MSDRSVNTISVKLSYARRRLRFWRQFVRTFRLIMLVGIALISSVSVLGFPVSLGLGIPLTVMSVIVLTLVYLLETDRRPIKPGYALLRDYDPNLPAWRMTVLDYWEWRVDYLGMKLSEAMGVA